MPLARSSASTADVAAAPVAAERTPEVLRHALRWGESDTERGDAAHDLATTDGAVEALADALEHEAAPRVREAIILSLVSIGSEQAAACIAAQLANPDAGRRNAAVDALRQIGIVAGHAVRQRLASPSRDERILAINVLETMDCDQARGWLREILAHDPEVTVGLAAVEALAQIGEPGDVEAMLAFAARFPNEPFAGFAVNLACRRAAAGGDR